MQERALYYEERHQSVDIAGTSLAACQISGVTVGLGNLGSASFVLDHQDRM
jgi:hypothetical protein